LRDARRKTGIGSSRELARLLDAQKVWDRNFDLSAPRSLTKAPEQPRTGQPWSKGTIAMLLSLSTAAALGLMVVADNPVQPPSPAQKAQATAQRSMPLVGRWSLDVGRIPAEERPRQVTISFQVSADGKWTTMVEIVAPDGTTRSATSTAALDGVPVPVTGNMDFIDTVSLRQPAPQTLVMTLGKGGAPVSTRVYSVTKDQSVMTETIVWPGEAMPRLETTYFKRID
jgi:hypothetical protein